MLGFFGEPLVPGGNCSRCQCNNNSDVCNTTTGECLNCQHNTTGFNCERCENGTWGNATQQQCQGNVSRGCKLRFLESVWSFAGLVQVLEKLENLGILEFILQAWKVVVLCVAAAKRKVSWGIRLTGSWNGVIPAR